MPPFNGHPQGFSASALALLDQGLNEIWHEMQIAADAKTKTAPRPCRRCTPPMSTINASRLCRRSRTIVAAIAK